MIEFSGNVAQVRNAFHTEIHHYLVAGERRMANASDTQIPAALAPVLTGVVSLQNFSLPLLIFALSSPSTVQRPQMK